MEGVQNEAEIVRANQLTKKYGSRPALKGISFKISGQKLIGLVGRNGAGKTTLMRLIAGHLRPSSGEICVFRRAPFDDLTVANNLILTSDRLTILPALTVEDVLEKMALFYPHWDHQLALKLCRYFELNRKASPQALSKGEQNTFYTILGLASRSPLTLLDEPFNGMDQGVRQDIYRLLLKEYLHHPRTILISSHLLNELEEILEEIILLDQGELKTHLAVEELDRQLLKLRGERRVLESVLTGRKILEKQELGMESWFVIIKNDLSPELLRTLKQQQVEVWPVPAHEACLVLTKRKEGSIDDVLAEN